MFKLVLRRRRPDLVLEEAVFHCALESAKAGKEDMSEEEIGLIVLDTEIQTNSQVLETPRQTVRMWFNVE